MLPRPYPTTGRPSRPASPAPAAARRVPECVVDLAVSGKTDHDLPGDVYRPWQPARVSPAMDRGLISGVKNGA